MADEYENEALEASGLIIANFVANNQVAQADLPALIRSIHQTVKNLCGPRDEPIAERGAPAVSIRKSITPDYLICLEDGAKLKMLKRYLRSRFDMTPAQYRAKWNLPNGYPMTAPNYSASRSNMAKAMGLGGGGRDSAQASNQIAPTASAAPKRRGRPPKAIDPATDTFR